MIIDGAVEPNYLEAIARETANCMAFGVSLLTGPVIRDAITASKLVRQLKPEIPIIFGGWHPTLLTSETLREPFVDVVVRHQGERTLTDILHHYQTGSTLDTVPGCWFKRDGKIYSNQDRPASPLTTLPPPAYDLVDFDVYARASGARKLPYATSIGCPYACNYCTDMVFYNRRFNPLDVAGVVRQIVELVERHRLDEVSLVDSNFLVNTPRALAIAREFIESGARFHWTFQASTNLLCRISDKDVCTLARSGVSHIGFGTESASPEVLRSMNKRHQSVPDMFEAARKCANAGIRVTYNLIFGYPGEEEWHRKQTLRVMGEIAERYHNVTFSPNVFTPYPGIPIWPELRALGLHEPTSLPEWASVGLGQVNLPWMNPASSKNTSAKLVLFPADKPASKDSTGIKKRHVAWT